MEFFFSSEVDQSALFQNHETEELVRPVLLEAIERSSLGELKARIRYIPIIMKEENRARYPARSRLERKNMIYNCCPQLGIQTFLTGTQSERIIEFVNGLRECGPALAKLGATDAQVADFAIILDDTIRMLTDPPSG